MSQSAVLTFAKKLRLPVSGRDLLANEIRGAKRFRDYASWLLASAEQRFLPLQETARRRELHGQSVEAIRKLGARANAMHRHHG